VEIIDARSLDTSSGFKVRYTEATGRNIRGYLTRHGKMVDNWPEIPEVGVKAQYF
jgi:hypothetical protein